MEVPTLTPAEDPLEAEWYEDEIELLAFDRLMRASRPEAEAGQDWAEPEARCHASCL